jgi:tripartite-type tricarboxylate transporter receptor subunit TctC
MNPTTRRATLFGAAALLGVASLPSFAQAYPGKPVRLIVPFPPAGSVDTLTRIVGQKLSEQWGQQVIVDNRAGAGGIVGADAAAHAPPDGYTLFVCSIHHSVLPSMKPKLPYDIEKDFAPLSFGARFPIVLVAHPSVAATSVKELIALAKQNPGKLAFGSAGNGGGTHLAGELFNLQAGTQLLHVPYKGSSPAVSDLLGGQVQLMFSDAPSVMQHIKSGKLRALGVANLQRTDILPGVPTIAESGLPGYEAYSWAAFMAPAGTPKEIVAKLSADIGKMLAQPDVKQRLFDAGAEAKPTTGEEFGKILNAEIVKWTKVVKAANIQPD